MKNLDAAGSAATDPHYPMGWSMAGNAPFKRWKQDTHAGGNTDPFIVSWPGKIKEHGVIRNQYHHLVDVVPTLLEVTGLPAPTVQKLVSRLTAAGLLRSSRGAGGGLKLARPAAAITLADIIEAVEGPIALTACVESGKHDCGMETACAVRPHWGVVNDAMRGALAEVPLTRLAGVAA